MPPWCSTEVTSAEVRKLRGLLSALPPGDRGPLACLAGLHFLHEAMQDYETALRAHDDAEVCIGSRLTRACLMLGPLEVGTE